MFLKGRLQFKIVQVISFLALVCLVAPVQAIEVTVSTHAPVRIQLIDNSFVTQAPGDTVIQFDTGVLNSARSFLPVSGNVNGFHIRENGNYLYSIVSGTKNTTFDDHHVVEYNPLTGVETLFFDFSTVATVQNGGDLDIDAVAEHNGLLIISNVADGITFGNSIFSKNDLIAFDPFDGSVSLFFDGGLISGGDQFNNVSGVNVSDDGIIAISVSTGNVPGGNGGITEFLSIAGTEFTRNDIVFYDPETGTASKALEGVGIFTRPGAIIDALYIKNEDKSKILAMANWAAINYPGLFFNAYNGPFTGFGYNYVCFNPSDNCIGVTQDGTQVDALINGEFVSIDSVGNVLNSMVASQNGILNLSAESVTNNIIPAIFSPGLGKTTETDSMTTSISWRITAANSPQEICDFLLSINAANTATASSATFVRVLSSGEGQNEWSRSTVSDSGLSGMVINYQNRTLTVTNDVVLSKKAGGEDELTIAAGSTLYF